jgi:tetratricopeptide (TPR) repeat protein
LGLVKVHNNAPEFGIEDMRSALQAGAAADGQLLLGDALLNVGLPADALDAFETLLRVAPKDATGRLGKARALGLLGRADGAATILKSLEESDPDLPGLWAAIALTRRQNKDLDGAAEAMRREVSENPLREHVATLVDLLLEQSKEEEAMTLLDTLYQQLHRADLALMAIQLTAAGGKEGEAQERLAAALAHHPDNVELLYLSAQRMLDDKDFGAAEEALMRLRKRDPENPQVLVDLALSRFGLEKAGSHGARTARETVKELEKNSRRRVFQVARVLSSWKYWDETEKIIEERLAKRPGSRRTTAWLYFFYLSHDKREKAKELRENPHPKLDEEDLEWLKQAYQRIDERVANEDK